jgi:hypothetical protein
MRFVINALGFPRYELTPEFESVSVGAMNSRDKQNPNELSVSEAEEIVGGGGRDLLGAGYRAVVGSTVAKPSKAHPIMIAARLCNLDPGSCVASLPHHPTTGQGPSQIA